MVKIKGGRYLHFKWTSKVTQRYLFGADRQAVIDAINKGDSKSDCPEVESKSFLAHHPS